MRPIWRAVSAAVASIAIVVVTGFGIMAYMFWPHCDRKEKVLARNLNGQSVMSEFEACTGLGTEMSQSIQLVSATGKRTTLLSYVPNGGVLGCKGKQFPGDAEPTAEWTDSNHIHIAIAVLSSIVEKHETANGFNITYELGPVLAEACN